MECVAVIACSSALIFARLAEMQDLNPFVWGFLAMGRLRRGAELHDLAGGERDGRLLIVWISSFGGLFVLLIVQSIVAAMRRRGNR